MKPLLTASLIVRDEESFIAECLLSLRDVVDEIVVVDTGSQDDTPAIAAMHGAEVHHRPWTGSFAAARNAALDLARGAWILYIDADERLDPVDRTEVARLLESADEVAFRLLLQPQRGMTPYREYRLWRNDPRIRFEGAMHEKVVPAIHAVADADDRQVGVCGLMLRHVGYEGDQTHKHRRNLPLLRAQLEVEPDNLFNLHHLARVLHGLGDPVESEATLVLAVERARAKPVIDPAGALAYTDLIAMRRGRAEDVDELLREAVDRYPDNCCLAWHQAHHLEERGDYVPALALFDRLLAVDTATLPDVGPAYDGRLFGELAHEGRALCLLRLGRDAEAAEAYAEAAALAPQEPSYAVKRDLARARARNAVASSWADR